MRIHLCTKKTKITTLFNNFFSSMSVFDVPSREYHDACEVMLAQETAFWCITVQNSSLLIHCLYILVRISKCWTKNCKSSSLWKSSDMFMKTVLCTACIFLPLLVNRCSASGLYIRTPASASAASHACVVVLSWKCVEDWHRREEIVEVIIFVLFAHKKYFHRFIKLRLNHWCHMDYFNYVLPF